MNTNKFAEEFRKDVEDFNISKFRSINVSLMLLYTGFPVCYIVYLLNSMGIIGIDSYNALKYFGLYILLYGFLPIISLALISDIITYIKVKREQKRLIKEAKNLTSPK